MSADEDPTKIMTAAGLMTVSEALANPDAFVDGMEVADTYCLFVPFTPTILRAMLGHLQAPCVIEPWNFLGKRGSLVTTHSKVYHEELCLRFSTRQAEEPQPEE